MIYFFRPILRRLAALAFPPADRLFFSSPAPFAPSSSVSSTSVVACESAVPLAPFFPPPFARPWLRWRAIAREALFRSGLPAGVGVSGPPIASPSESLSAYASDPSSAAAGRSWLGSEAWADGGRNDTALRAIERDSVIGQVRKKDGGLVRLDSGDSVPSSLG